tara:strand:+ start:636 stop:881 length:246 start_codon:yes stop_codon:yes gene_type:complete
MYKPKVNHYVKWKTVEGWIYFSDPEYITIEIDVKPKPNCPISTHKHLKTHILVLCHHWNWHELEYLGERSVNTETVAPKVS